MGKAQPQPIFPSSRSRPRREKLTPEREIELIRQLNGKNSKKARKARDELILSHETLVHQIARRYVADPGRFDDIIQEGFLGLMRAAETFNLDHKVRFSTYASYWIRSKIQRYLAGIRSHEYGAPASVAWACGRTRGKDGYRALFRSLSLDDRAPGEDDRSLMEMLPSDTPGPEREVAERELHTLVGQALARAAEKLDDPRAITMIEARLLAEEPATFAELGRALNLSREGARLLEMRLLKRTRDELGALQAAQA
jgi:RNA polymerase sigma-32 factor